MQNAPAVEICNHMKPIHHTIYNPTNPAILENNNTKQTLNDIISCNSNDADPYIKDLLE